MKRALLVLLAVLSACAPSLPAVVETPTAPRPDTTPAAAVTLVVPIDQPLLVWEQSDAPCRKVTFTLSSVDFGACAPGTIPILSAAHFEQLAEFARTYAPFEALTPAGYLRFAGLGARPAAPAEQRMLAEWAHLRADEAEAGRAGAAWGLVLSWHRQGGIAGFCDDLSVYRDGLVVAGDCHAGGPIMEKRSRLTAAELERLYALLDRYAAAEAEVRDPAVADAMTTRVIFAGDGSQTPASADLLLFGTDLNIGHGWAGAELSAVRALSEFFRLLNNGRYGEAVAYYGGSYETLMSMNPGQDEPTALLRAGCEQNGFRCLKVLSIASIETIAEGGYLITVRFINPDDTLFARGPCCGETSGEPVSEFTYTVRLVDGAYKVMELPPYVP